MTTTTTLPTFEEEEIGEGNGLITMFNMVVELKNCFGFATCKMEITEADAKADGGTIGGTAQVLLVNAPVKCPVSAAVRRQLERSIHRHRSEWFDHREHLSGVSSSGS